MFNFKVIIIFSHVDDLVKCYDSQNVAGCFALQSFVQYVPSQEELMKQFTNACAQKDGKYNKMHSNFDC